MSRSLQVLDEESFWATFTRYMVNFCQKCHIDLPSRYFSGQMRRRFEGALTNGYGRSAVDLLQDPLQTDRIMEIPFLNKFHRLPLVPGVREALAKIIRDNQAASAAAIGGLTGGGAGRTRTPAVPFVPVVDGHSTVGRPVSAARSSVGQQRGSGHMPRTSLPILMDDDDDRSVDSDDEDDDDEDTGKVDVGELRCGARYFPDIDGRPWITVDTDGIGKRIAEWQHLIRMMEKLKLLDLFGSGLRLDLERIRSFLAQMYARALMKSACPMHWDGMRRYAQIKDLPAIASDAKFGLLLKGKWDWRTVRELSLMDFVAGGNTWRCWEAKLCTVGARQMLVMALQNVLLVLEILFGIPGHGIADPLIEVLQCDDRMLGATDALCFHLVNEVFANAFQDARERVVTSTEKKQRVRLYGVRRWAKRLGRELVAIVDKLPQGVTETVVLRAFNTVTYASIEWHVKPPASGVGSKRSPASRGGDGLEVPGALAGKKTKVASRGEKLRNKPAGRSGDGAGGGSADDEEEEHDLPLGNDRICPFRLAGVLKIKNASGQIHECRDGSRCKMKHISDLTGCTLDEIKRDVRSFRTISKKTKEAILKEAEEKMKEGTTRG
jgi:hypothetical protein